MPQAADGDGKQGAQLYHACVACRSLEAGVNLSGPSLTAWDKNSGFVRCSKGLKSADFVWNAQTLFAWVGDPPKALPGIRFVDSEGRNRVPADFKGKVVLLYVWATWCVPFRKEMPTLDHVQDALGGSEFQVVALSIDHQGPDVVRKFYGQIGIKRLDMHVDSGGKAARELGAVGLPTTLLIDHAVRGIGRLIGSAEWDTPDMIAFIRRRIDEQHNRP